MVPNDVNVKQSEQLISVPSVSGTQQLSQTNDNKQSIH